VGLILLLTCLALPCLAQPDLNKINQQLFEPPAQTVEGQTNDPAVDAAFNLLLNSFYRSFYQRVAYLAIADQTDPAKLATLKGERAANPRLQRCVYWLATAEAAGEKPEAVLDDAAKNNGTAVTPYAGFVRWGLLENLKIAKELGLLTPEGMAELRRGKSATITKGQYTGQKAEAENVIPRTVCPELANQVMNLELLPASLNRAKSDKVTDRARVFAKELYDAKLLSEEGWKRVEK